MTTQMESERAEIGDLLANGQPINDEGFSIIYRHYKRALTKYAAWSGASDPEGAANLALFDGYRAIDRLENRSENALRSYLRRATLGHVIDDYHRVAPEPTEIEDDEIVLGDHSEFTVEQIWLRELVEELPPDQRSVIESRFYQELSGREASQQLNKDPNAVYQLQHRAIHRLRRIVFTAIFVALAIVGAVAIRQAFSASSTVDSSPVDTPEERMPVPPPADVDANRADGSAPDADASDVGPTERADGQIVADQTVETTPTSGATSTVPEVAGSVPASPGIAGPTTTTPAPVAQDVPPSATPVVSPSVLNHCAPHLLSPTLLNLKLYNPANSWDTAAAFVPPAAVRFLDDAGAELYRVDTSGPLATSLEPGSHGWIGEGNASGTYALYANAPRPSYWGVLADAESTVNWQSIQALDPVTGSWLETEACQS